MDVFVFSICLDQAGVSGHVGQDPELDLGVVRVGEGISVAGDEGLADLAAQVRLHGDVLQIGICRADAPGGCDGLLEGSVDPAVVRHIGHEAVRIGRAQLCEAAVLEDIIDDRVFGRQLLQDACGGGVAGLGLFASGKAHFFKKDLAQLFGRSDIEGLSCLFVNLLFELVDPAAQALAVGAQGFGLDADSQAFHIGEDKGQRALYLRVEAPHLLFFKLCADRQCGLVQDLRGAAGIAYDRICFVFHGLCPGFLIKELFSGLQ